MKNINLEERVRKIENSILSQKRVLTFNENAAYIGLSKSYLYKLTSTGGIPCYKPHGKHIYFDRLEIENWLLKNKKLTNAEIDVTASTYISTKKGG